MHRPFISTALVLSTFTLISAFTPRLSAQIINGGFESPYIPGPLGSPNVAVDTAGGSLIPNWSVTSGAVTLVNPGIVGNITGLLAADSGSQYVVLEQLTIAAGNIVGVSAPGTLSQTFATTPGDLYTISYAYSGINLNLLGSTSTLGVTVSGYNPYSASSGLLTVGANSFQTTSFNFTATGPTSDLTFNETAGDVANGGGIGLDSVSTTDNGPAPVPEPAQSALLGIGLLVALAALRHRSGAAKPALVPAGNLA